MIQQALGVLGILLVLGAVIGISALTRRQPNETDPTPRAQAEAAAHKHLYGGSSRATRTLRTPEDASTLPDPDTRHSS